MLNAPERQDWHIGLRSNKGVTSKSSVRRLFFFFSFSFFVELQGTGRTERDGTARHGL